MRKTFVGLVENSAQSAGLFFVAQEYSGAVGRTIIDDDNFQGVPGAVLVDRSQALLGQRQVVKSGNDDRDQRHRASLKPGSGLAHGRSGLIGPDSSGGLKPGFTVRRDDDIRGDFLAPLLLQQVDVPLLFAESLGSTLRLVVNYDGGGLINDAQPLLSHTKAKVNVLISVPKLLIEPV